MKLRSNISGHLTDLMLGSDGRLIIKQLNVVDPPDTPTSVVTKQYLDNRISAAIDSPGNVLFKPSKTTPAGYLKCNGSAVPRTTYAGLYSVIGDNFSSFPAKGSGQPWKLQYGINVTLDLLTSKAWYKDNTLLTTNAFSQVIVTKNRVYLISRYSGTTYTAVVYTAPIAADGTVGTWVTSTITIPQALSYSQAVVVTNYVYLIGGYNGTYRTNIYRAIINTDGTIGNFVAYSNLPIAISHSQAVITKNRIYLIAGYVGGVVANKVYTATIDTVGNIGSWALGPALNVEIYNHYATVVRDRIYVIGGANSNGDSKAIYYADINADGTIDSWTEDFPLPDTVHSGAMTCSRNNIYLFGGMVKGVASNNIYQVDINQDGTMGGWDVIGTLPETSYGAMPFVTSNCIYLLGGYLAGVISNKVNVIDMGGGLNDYSNYYNPVNSELPNGTFRLPDYSFLEPYRLYAYMKY